MWTKKKKQQAEEEEGGTGGCAVLCRDGVVGLMVAGPLRPLRLRPPSPAPRYQPSIPLRVPQGSTALPPTKPALVLALSGIPHQPSDASGFHPGTWDAGSGASPLLSSQPPLQGRVRWSGLVANRLPRRAAPCRLCRKPSASQPGCTFSRRRPFSTPAAHFPRPDAGLAMLVIALMVVPAVSLPAVSLPAWRMAEVVGRRCWWWLAGWRERGLMLVAQASPRKSSLVHRRRRRRRRRPACPLCLSPRPGRPPLYYIPDTFVSVRRMHVVTLLLPVFVQGRAIPFQRATFRGRERSSGGCPFCASSHHPYFLPS